MTGPSKPRCDVFMLADGEGGTRLCIYREGANAAPSRGGIVFAQPFAEEMNKTRRAVAVATRALAEDGWCTLQIDLQGCGDSSGDLSDTTWDRWQKDLRIAAGWLRQRGIPVRVLWGLRLGALLASTIVEGFDGAPHLLLWQPVITGKGHLTQFLRLKAMEGMLGGSDEKRSTARLRQDLAAGETIEVAGYALNPALARAIDAASLNVPDGYCGRILWLETGLDDAAELPPASAQKVAALTAAGHVVTSRTVPGRAFWQTVEIEECPALVGATVAALRELPITDHARP